MTELPEECLPLPRSHLRKKRTKCEALQEGMNHQSHGPFAAMPVQQHKGMTLRQRSPCSQ